MLQPLTLTLPTTGTLCNHSHLVLQRLLYSALSFTFSSFWCKLDLTTCCVFRIPYLHAGDEGINVSLLLLAHSINMGTLFWILPNLTISELCV